MCVRLACAVEDHILAGHLTLTQQVILRFFCLESFPDGFARYGRPLQFRTQDIGVRSALGYAATQRAIRDLEARGYLIRVASQGKRIGPGYRVNVDLVRSLEEQRAELRIRRQVAPTEDPETSLFNAKVGTTDQPSVSPSDDKVGTTDQPWRSKAGTTYQPWSGSAPPKVGTTDQAKASRLVPRTKLEPVSISTVRSPYRSAEPTTKPPTPTPTERSGSESESPAQTTKVKTRREAPARTTRTLPTGPAPIPLAEATTYLRRCLFERLTAGQATDAELMDVLKTTVARDGIGGGKVRSGDLGALINSVRGELATRAGRPRHAPAALVAAAEAAAPLAPFTATHERKIREALARAEHAETAAEFRALVDDQLRFLRCAGVMPPPETWIADTIARAEADAPYAKAARRVIAPSHAAMAR